jgi:hypothetical protein
MFNSFASTSRMIALSKSAMAECMSPSSLSSCLILAFFQYTNSSVLKKNSNSAHDVSAEIVSSLFGVTIRYLDLRVNYFSTIVHQIWITQFAARIPL